MATQPKKKTGKKPAAQRAAATSKTVRKVKTSASVQLFSSQAVQVLVFIFAILCVTFAIMAFYRYA